MASIDETPIDMGPSFQPVVTKNLGVSVDGAPEVSTSKIVSICLVGDESQMATKFWVTFTKKGALQPSEALDMAGVSSMIRSLNADGLTETGPLMLVRAENGEAISLFVTPRPEGGFREQALWVQEVASTISSWGLKNVGFYLPHFEGDLVKSSELLIQILTTLINQQVCESYYLFVGEYNYNSLLNLALAVKADLESNDLTIHVQH